jgi:hypothetical protein
VFQQAKSYNLYLNMEELEYCSGHSESAKGRRFHAKILAQTKHFSVLQNVQIGSAPPELHIQWVRRFLPRVRRPETEVYNLPPPRRVVKNKCSYTCTPPV